MILFGLSSAQTNRVLPYLETPIQPVSHGALERAGITLHIKREDLNHPAVSGNKWWKLKYNLQAAIREGHQKLLTFGGAFSNHIHSTAAAAHALGLKSIGVIRGEYTPPLNDTLRAAKGFGMRLHYLPRHIYREKDRLAVAEELKVLYGTYYAIPEGGTNALAVKGVAEFAASLGNQFDYLCCAVGTGGTLAGLIQGIDPGRKIIGFPVLKSGDSLSRTIEQLSPGHVNWQLVPHYHFGGYARNTPVLERFIQEFSTQQGIPLEFVYTGKMLYGIFDLVSLGFFPKGARILAVHSGGIR